MGRKREWGFTLIELMIVVAIIGVLAAIAIPAFMKYIKKSKTSEARLFVKKIYDGARAYYMDPNIERHDSIQPLPAQFPSAEPAGYPVAATTNWRADADCCAMTTASTREKCAPNETIWSAPVWVALSFGVPDPHYYAYRYTNSDLINSEMQFTAQARGDLDCDDQFSLYEMYGVVDSSYADGPAGTALLRRVDELE